MNKFKKSEYEKKSELQVGAGLLSPVSLGADVVSDTIVNIDMDLIIPNKMNEFSMDELEELAELISAAKGIWQPLILKPDKNPDGTYTLTTGERRWRAAHIARDNGKYQQINKVDKNASADLMNKLIVVQQIMGSCSIQFILS